MVFVKKKIMLIVIGIGLIFVSSILLSLIMTDFDLAFRISMGIGIAYFILLTIISYIKNISKYLKTGEIPNTSSLAIWAVALLGHASGKGFGTSLTLLRGAQAATNEFSNTSKKLGMVVYTLINIALWSFLCFISYFFVFGETNSSIVTDILLYIITISLFLAIIIILIVGIKVISYKKESAKKSLSRHMGELQEKNPLQFSFKSFILHYGIVYVILAVLGIIETIFMVWCVSQGFNVQEFMTVIFGETLGGIFAFICGLLFLYVLVGIPVVLLVVIKNLQLQTISFNPLKIKMITKEGNDGYGTYEKVEKNYFVNEIESYSITNRWFIINGQIESVIHKTVNNSTKEKNKTLNKLKIPRVFSNENIFIEYLEKSLKK